MSMLSNSDKSHVDNSLTNWIVPEIENTQFYIKFKEGMLIGLNCNVSLMESLITFSTFSINHCSYLKTQHLHMKISAVGFY